MSAATSPCKSVPLFAAERGRAQRACVFGVEAHMYFFYLAVNRGSLCTANSQGKDINFPAVRIWASRSLFALPQQGRAGAEPPRRRRARPGGRDSGASCQGLPFFFFVFPAFPRGNLKLGSNGSPCRQLRPGGRRGAAPRCEGAIPVWERCRRRVFVKTRCKCLCNNHFTRSTRYSVLTE